MEQPENLSAKMFVDYNGDPIGSKQQFTEMIEKVHEGLSEEDITDALVLRRLGGLIGKQDTQALAKELGIEGVDANMLNSLTVAGLNSVADARNRIPRDEIVEKIAEHFGTSLEELKS